MSCCCWQSSSNQQLNAACASSAVPTHNAAFKTPNLFSKWQVCQMISSAYPQTSSYRLLYWICRLRTDKYKRVCWSREFESFLSSISDFFFFLQPISVFIELSSPLLAFPYPPYMYCVQCIHLSAGRMFRTGEKKKIKWFSQNCIRDAALDSGLRCNSSPRFAFISFFFKSCKFIENSLRMQSLRLDWRTGFAT